MIFEVKALAPSGAVVVMRVEAPAEQDARREAELGGMSVFAARPVGGKLRRASSRSTSMQVLPFVQELLTLLRAGLSLVAALEAISEKEAHSGSRAVVESLLLRLRRGGRLSEAMIEAGPQFPQILIAGIRASERNGSLDEALQRYCDYAGRMDAVRKKIIAAMIYPTLLLLVGLLVSAFLIGYVVPKFASVYRDSGGEMPWASALLMDIGRVIGGHLAEFGLAFLVLVVFAVLAWSRTATREWFARMARALPGVGPRIRIYEMARLYRTLAMLLRGGTPIVPALGLASNMLSVGMRAQLARSANLIAQGAPISRALDENGLTTPVGNRMLGVGEHGGGMVEMLERIADYHDEETARWVDWASRLFEPMMMAMLGLVIGGIVILLYMPIFDLAGTVQ
jgi:general secretion pathway protein F